MIVRAALVAAMTVLPAAEGARVAADPYGIALEAALEVLAEVPGRRDAPDVIVQEADGITQKLPARIGPFRITVLDHEGLRARAEMRGAETVLVIHPMELAQHELVFRITVTEHSCRPRKGRLWRRGGLDYALCQGAHVTLRYDSGSGRFTVTGAELWGV